MVYLFDAEVMFLKCQVTNHLRIFREKKWNYPKRKPFLDRVIHLLIYNTRNYYGVLFCFFFMLYNKMHVKTLWNDRFIITHLRVLLTKEVADLIIASRYSYTAEVSGRVSLNNHFHFIVSNIAMSCFVSLLLGVFLFVLGCFCFVWFPTSLQSDFSDRC